MRRRSSIASKSPVNSPANRVRKAGRIDAAGAGPGWAVWDHPRDAASAVKADAAIRLLRDVVIVSPLGSIAGAARPPEQGCRTGRSLYALTKDPGPDFLVWMLSEVTDANDV